VAIPSIVFHEMTAMSIIQDVAGMSVDTRMGAVVAMVPTLAGCGARSEYQTAKNKKNRLDAIRYHSALPEQQVNERLT
jgi:hypothetical protein